MATRSQHAPPDSNTPPAETIDAAPAIDANGLYEIELNPTLRVKLKKLSVFESIQADEICGPESNDNKVSKVYAVCSIREVNGKPVFPLRNRLEFADLAEKIDLGEGLLLIAITSKMMKRSMSADLKNALAAQGLDL